MTVLNLKPRLIWEGDGNTSTIALTVDDSEDAELDRLNNAVWPQEIAIGIAIIGLIAAAVFYYG